MQLEQDLDVIIGLLIEFKAWETIDHQVFDDWDINTLREYLTGYANIYTFYADNGEILGVAVLCDYDDENNATLHFLCHSYVSIRVVIKGFKILLNHIFSHGVNGLYAYIPHNRSNIKKLVKLFEFETKYHGGDMDVYYLSNTHI